MGLYETFVTSVLAPFLNKCRYVVLVFWGITFILGLAIGTRFFGLLQNDGTAPANTYASRAEDAYDQAFVGVPRGQPPILVVSKLTDDQYPLSNWSSEVQMGLQAESDAVPHRSIGVSPGYPSADGKTMLWVVGINGSLDNQGVTDYAADMDSYTNKYESPHYTVHATGLFVLLYEGSVKIQGDIFLVDPIVLLIGLLILGYYVQSWRLMLVALCTVILTILTAMLFMVPVALSWNVVPYTPAIMISMGVAISFDYSLFLCTRFREEIENGKTFEVAIVQMLIHAGHVVLTSGTTLTVCFLVILVFPNDFLRSVGISAALILLCSMWANLTLMPAFLYSFPNFFSVFEFIPGCCKQKCCPSQSEEGPEDCSSKVSRCTGRFWLRMAIITTTTVYAIPILIAILVFCVPILAQMKDILITSDLELVYAREGAAAASLKIITQNYPPGLLNPYLILMTTDTPNGILTEKFFAAQNELLNDVLSLGQHTNWLIPASITGLTFVNSHNVSYSDGMAYLNANTAIFNSTDGAAFRGVISDAGTTNFGLSATMATLQTTRDPMIEDVVDFMLDTRKLCQQVQDRYADPMYFKNGTDSEVNIKIYLRGGYTWNYDGQEKIYGMFPALVGATIAIVFVLIAFMFGSLFVAIRLVLTIGIVITTVYGFMVIVYQPGQDRDNFNRISPGLSDSTGIYWLVPLMSFSILVGLALDYDIFLLSRVVEYRDAGWSDRVSTLVGLERTGSLITAAGSIMAISFGALLGSDILVLQQYGFSLFLGVLLDTFVVRTLLVPALFTLTSYASINWWPAEKPPLRYTDPREEMDAMMKAFYSGDKRHKEHKHESEPIKGDDPPALEMEVLASSGSSGGGGEPMTTDGGVAIE